MTKNSTHSNVMICCYWRKPEENITQLLYILIYKLLSLSGGLLSICNLPSSTMQLFSYPVFSAPWVGLGWDVYTLCAAWLGLDLILKDVWWLARRWPKTGRSFCSPAGAPKELPPPQPSATHTSTIF